MSASLLDRDLKQIVRYEVEKPNSESGFTMKSNLEYLLERCTTGVKVYEQPLFEGRHNESLAHFRPSEAESFALC